MSDGNKKDDPLDNFIAALFLAILVAILIYFFYIDIWYKVRTFTFSAISFLPDQIRNILFFYAEKASAVVPAMLDDLRFHAKDFDVYYREDDVGINKKTQMDAAARILFFPYIAILVGYLVVKELMRKYGKITKPGGRNAMYNYALTQMEIWPFIKTVAPIMKSISRNDDLDSGPNAIPKLPLLWMKENNLLNEVKTQKERDLFTVRQRVQFTLDRPKAYNLLVKNLGRPWAGFDDLTFTEQCVFAILVPHIYGKVKESRLNNRRILQHFGYAITEKNQNKIEESRVELEKYINNVNKKYSESFVQSYFDPEGFDDPYDPIISSFQTLDTEKDMFDKGEKLIQETLLTHRYVKTIFFSLMEKSWTYGVLSSGELLWVKSVDRDLFYVLSQQGRNSAFVEVAGCWGHYLTESSLGFKMLSPQVFNAIEALDYDLYETHSNYIKHGKWGDNSRWDKIVPDSMQQSSALPKGPQGGGSQLY